MAACLSRSTLEVSFLRSSLSRTMYRVPLHRGLQAHLPKKKGNCWQRGPWSVKNGPSVLGPVRVYTLPNTCSPLSLSLSLSLSHSLSLTLSLSHSLSLSLSLYFSLSSYLCLSPFFADCLVLYALIANQGVKQK